MRQPTTPLRIATVLIGTAMLLACNAESAPPVASVAHPRIELVDSLVLADTGALTLGDLVNAGLHVTDRVIWIGDPQNGRVVRFTRRGAAIDAIGQKGRGPGEIEATGPITPLPNQQVGVWDFIGNKLVGYNAVDGSVAWEYPVLEQALPMQMQAVGDTVWFGTVSRAEHTGALRVMLPRGPLEHVGRLPADYAAGLSTYLPYSVAVRFGDTLLVGYAGDRHLYLYLDSGAVDSVEVPVRARRGIPADLWEQAQNGLTTRTGKGLENFVSTLARVARLPDGRVALVHFDVDFDPQTSPQASVQTWLSVVDDTFTRVCADAPLPLSERTIPSFAFSGDTLFTLEQTVDGDDAVPVVRTFVVSTDGCEWTQIPRMSRPGA